MNTHGRVAGATLAIWLGLAPGAFGQDAGQKDVRKIYTKNLVFKLPVQIDEKDRDELTGLKLFFKAIPGAWQCRESAPATQKEFSFHAPQDGEYWFSFATVDKSGAVTPASPDQEPPGLVVVVDSRPPEITVRTLPTDSTPGYLLCKLIDANPDYQSVKMEYEAAVKGGPLWQPLEPVADTPGVFHVPNKSVLAGRIRVRAADRAGHFAEREINLGDSHTPAANPQTAVAADPVPAAKPLIPLPVVAAMADNAPPPIAMPSDVAVPRPLQPASLSRTATDPLPLPPALTAPNQDIVAINTRRCNMAISIESPSDEEAKVEAWATGDSGRSWSQVGQTRDGKTVIQAEFPRDGIYGYTFVIKSPGGGQPPAPGDTPDGWIEVDTTKPVAEILGIALGTGTDARNLIITWVAQDRNFAAAPISLYYASQPTGPWQPVAEKLANTGSYHWPLPKNLGGRVYVRLGATDRAGNATLCDYPTPLQLETTRPKVRVLSVTPAGKD